MPGGQPYKLPRSFGKPAEAHASWHTNTTGALGVPALAAPLPRSAGALETVQGGAPPPHTAGLCATA